VPPTFLIYLATILYFGISCLTLIVFIPMFFFKKMRALAKIIIATVLISLPCLIIVTIFFLTVFAVPAFSFWWLVKKFHLPEGLNIFVSLVGCLLFVISVIVGTFYLWELMSRIIWQWIERKPLNEILNKNKLIQFYRNFNRKIKV
jgi:hypothetical protein